MAHNFTLRRLLPIALSVAIFAMAGRVLWHTLHHIKLADVLAALHAIPPSACWSAPCWS